MYKVLRKILLFFDVGYQSFDSNLWKSKPEKRKNLIHDVLRRNLAVGKNHEQVLGLFGDEPRIYTNGSWSYPISFFKDGAPKKFLQLYFNSADVVTHTKIKLIIKE